MAECLRTRPPALLGVVGGASRQLDLHSVNIEDEATPDAEARQPPGLRLSAKPNCRQPEPAL